MEIALKNYLTTTEQIENDLVKSNKQFQERIKLSCSWNGQTRKNTIAAMCSLMNSQIPQKKMEQYLITGKSWWENFVFKLYPEEQCLEFLRCSRKTYVYLMRTLRPYLRPKWKLVKNVNTTKSKKGVTTAKQVAITLYKLGCRGDSDELSHMFGIEKSIVYDIFYNVIKNICKHLLPTVVNMPKATEAMEIAKCFEKTSIIPQIIGVMDIIHIPINNSTENPENIFTNSNNYQSFIAQIIIDSNNCFRDLSIRHPGSINDSTVLKDSNIYKLNQKVIPQGPKNDLGVDISYQIVAPHYYPLLPWLLKEYIDPMTEGEFLFNDHLQIIKNHGANAIDKMRARFSCLCQPMDTNYKYTPQLVAACCVLHNICEKNCDQLPNIWHVEAKTLQKKYPQPERILRNETAINAVAVHQRNTIRDYLEVIGMLNSDDL